MCWGGIIQSMDWRHAEKKSRVSARWRWAASRARVGAAAATVIALVIERQINGFMGFWAGTGSASRSLKRTAIALNK